MKTFALFLAGVLACSLAAPIYAQTATELNGEITKMNSLTTRQGNTRVVEKISSDFDSFLGPDANSVVTGLRNGTPIELTSTTTTVGSTPGAAPVTTTETTIINPPTGKMGYGNVYTSLALAKQQLSVAGITEPTPQELQAALTGGTITSGTGPEATTTTMEGILTMRSQKMGWGQISKKLGYKLGPVISGMKSANKNLATATTSVSSETSTTHAAARSKAAYGKGIVSGNGKSQANNGHAVANGKSNKGAGSSIVSASGGGSGKHSGAIVSGSGRGLSSGQSHGYGRGIVSGSGHGVSPSGGAVSTGRGNGGAHGKSHTK